VQLPKIAADKTRSKIADLMATKFNRLYN